MFKKQPILCGKSDVAQAHMIFDLVGSPNDKNMPGWSDLPGCEGTKSFDFKVGNIFEQFKEYVVAWHLQGITNFDQTFSRSHVSSS